jgi:hypothetical protein
VRRWLFVVAVLAAALAARLAFPDPVLRVGRARSANRAKASVERHLENIQRRHVVFVRYGRFADVHDDWVWNGADIDAQPIVWARAMSATEDAELRFYYRDRQAWRVTIGVERPGLIDFDEMKPDAVGYTDEKARGRLQ